MIMNYQFWMKNKQATPQSQPIPGKQMIQGRSGGYVFQADNWQMVRRCLITETAGGAFYVGRNECTDEFVKTIQVAAQEDTIRLAEEIVYASDGRSINNSAPILALVLLSMTERKEAKKAFLEIFPQVVRTASHFYEWISYSKGLRGMGRVVREAGTKWLTRENVKELAYQFLKYQQRHGFSHRDVLRLFHVKPPTASHDALFEWVVKGWSELPPSPPSPTFDNPYYPLSQIYWYEWLKRNPDQTHVAIREGKLTHEMVAPIGNMDREAWQLLFEGMPLGALLRDLASLTEIGVLRPDAGANLDLIESKLLDRDYLRKARIHPIDILKALKTYTSGGRLGRSKKTWDPVPRIVDILDDAVELAFEVQEPTGKMFVHAVDVSGSMTWSQVESVNLMASEIAAAMALTTVKAEKNYMIRGFSTQFIDLGVTKKDSFRDTLRKTSERTFGATDASVAWDYLVKEKIHTDVAVFWTDSESWAGGRHTSQALQEYRKRVNPNVKAIYVTLTPYQITLVDPSDPLSYDLGGFDSSMPKLIQMIASGEM
jgi:60 kDa SS-A/Ro ribonucleoprotein